MGKFLLELLKMIVSRGDLCHGLYLVLLEFLIKVLLKFLDGYLVADVYFVFIMRFYRLDGLLDVGFKSSGLTIELN